MGNPILAFVFVRTDVGPDIAGLLTRIPEAVEVHRVAGEDGYLVKVQVANSEELGRLLTTKIETIESITSARTTVVLKTVKQKQRTSRKIAATARS